MAQNATFTTVGADNEAPPKGYDRLRRQPGERFYVGVTGNHEALATPTKKHLYGKP